MLFDVFVAICLQAVPTPQCTERTAVAWFAAPEPTGFASCGFQAQAAVARTSLLHEGEYMRVFCRPVKSGARDVVRRPVAPS